MLCYIDDVDITPESIIEELVADGMYCPPNVIHGVTNLFGNIMPDCVEFHGEICSPPSQIPSPPYCDFQKLGKNSTSTTNNSNRPSIISQM